MAKKLSEVFQFKISLNGSKPLIWRRILVPSSYSFWDLHVAIQDSMGWHDYHLHMFNIKHPATGLRVEIGIPDGTGEVFGTSELPGHKEKISGYFIGKNSSARYEYDFGDSWVHTVKLEKILPAAPGEKYPKCIGGKMACPPEDCGGIYGYYDLLSTLSDPKNEEYEETVEWLGRKIDPEQFDPEAVLFDNPKWRWKQRFE